MVGRFPGASQFPQQALLLASLLPGYFSEGRHWEGSLLLRAKSCKRGWTRSSSTAAVTREAGSALTAQGSTWKSGFLHHLQTLPLLGLPHTVQDSSSRQPACVYSEERTWPLLPKGPALTSGNRHVDRARFRFPMNFPRLVSVSVLLLRKLFSEQTLHPSCWSEVHPHSPIAIRDSPEASPGSEPHGSDMEPGPWAGRGFHSSSQYLQQGWDAEAHHLTPREQEQKKM